MALSINEKAIILMYSGGELDRDKTISSIRLNLPFIEEQEIQETMESVIRKINAMRQEVFAEIDLTDAEDIVDTDV